MVADWIGLDCLSLCVIKSSKLELLESHFVYVCAGQHGGLQEPPVLFFLQHVAVKATWLLFFVAVLYTFGSDHRLMCCM